MPSRSRTISLIALWHAGQLYAGRPYYLHPVEVAGLIPDASDTEFHAALLHDVLEDTNISADDLSAHGYSDAIIDILHLVSKLPGETYFDFIRRVIASGNVSAVKVKFADNLANHNQCIYEKNMKRAEKYLKSMRMLLQAYPELSVYFKDVVPT